MKNNTIQYKEKLKENIKLLIEQGKMEDSKELIKQYENIIQNDIEIYSIKSVIYMLEENVDKAESILLNGLKIDKESFDLLYNLAYLYQSNSQDELAIKYYKRALKNAKSHADADEVYKILLTLGVEEDKEELVNNDINDTSAEDGAKNNINVPTNNQEIINVDDELENYKKQFKERIQLLIEQGLLQEVKGMLKEYETIIKDDIDIYSIKGIIAMVEGDLDEAKRMLYHGLTIDGENFDLLYNSAYIYQRNNENELAIEYYIQALKNAKNATDEEGVYERLMELGVKKSKEEIIGTTKPRTSIVILTYNNLGYNKLCIESIRKHTQKDTYEIIVVDNHSTDGTVEWLKQQNDLKLVLNDENLGFPKGCNQGIEIAEKDNDILLLNNDTIVTPNWLTNLKECLYSTPNIGSVGSVTNSCSNYQTITANYNNLDEMVTFATNNNISNSGLWEERLRLVGFCMLIKNEVVKKIGLLDEIYTPGNFEDDDYSLRIRQAGYRLMLCKDSFIHHFGSVSFGKNTASYNTLLKNNREKFINKWGFDPHYIMEIRQDITSIIKETAEEHLNVLEVGCAAGGTLLDIKNNLPLAKLYGIEENRDVIINTTHFARIYEGGVEKVKAFSRSFFNYIIIRLLEADIDGIIDNVRNIREHLKDTGMIIAVLSKEVTIKQELFIKELQKIFLQPYYVITETEKDKVVYMFNRDEKKINKLLPNDNMESNKLDMNNGVITSNHEISKLFYNFGSNSVIGTKYQMNDPASIYIGDNVMIKNDCWLNLAVPNTKSHPKIIINDGCQIGSRFIVSVSNKAILEKNVIIGPNVYITDCDHYYKDIGIPIMYQGVTSITNEVIIGEGSWLGINSVIVGNVRIGKGCVVGANSLVQRDMPDYSVAVGSPAKIIKIFDTITQDWVSTKNEEEINQVLKSRKDKPLISIGIPTYNRAKDLDKCLQSIFSQIGNDSLFEVYISNNDSKDDTEKVIIKYMKSYKNITYNKNDTNIGAVNNIEKVIRQSRGKYIMLHGDDDFFRPGTIYRIMNIITKNKECGIFFLNVLNDNKEVKVLKDMNNYLKETSIGSSFISSLIISREEHAKLKDPFKFKNSQFNQIYMQYSILQNNPKFCIINDAMFTYAGNSPVDYNFGEVFIKNYLEILNYFLDKGLSEEYIRLDKRKILETTILPWYRRIVQNNLPLDIGNFKEIFIEHYRNEDYFESVYDIVKKIEAREL